MEEHIAFLMHQAVWQMELLADRILRQHFSISYRRYYFLLKVSMLPSTTQRLLATHLGYSAAAVSRMTKQLEEEGWLTVTADPKHARRNQLVLTQKGQVLVRKATRLLLGFFDRTMKSGDVDVKAYAETTRRIREVLQQCSCK